MKRGTPLAEVLRAQAQDAREEGRRALMEAGGRNDIAMIFPVIFDLELSWLFSRRHRPPSSLRARDGDVRAAQLEDCLVASGNEPRVE